VCVTGPPTNCPKFALSTLKTERCSPQTPTVSNPNAVIAQDVGPLNGQTRLRTTQHATGTS